MADFKLLLTVFAFGVIAGMVAMYYMRRPEVGNKYNIDAKVKNKKGVMRENIFESKQDFVKPKDNKRESTGILRRLLTKKKKA